MAFWERLTGENFSQNKSERLTQKTWVRTLKNLKSDRCIKRRKFANVIFLYWLSHIFRCKIVYWIQWYHFNSKISPYNEINSIQSLALVACAHKAFCSQCFVRDLERKKLASNNNNNCILPGLICPTELWRPVLDWIYQLIGQELVFEHEYVVGMRHMR